MRELTPAEENIYFMLSTIKVETDFTNGNTFFCVMNNRYSQDMRDKAIAHFRRMFGYTSSWAKIVYPDYTVADGFSYFEIHPITPDQLRKEAAIMLEQADLIENNKEQPSLSH